MLTVSSHCIFGMFSNELYLSYASSRVFVLRIRYRFNFVLPLRRLFELIETKIRARYEMGTRTRSTTSRRKQIRSSRNKSKEQIALRGDRRVRARLDRYRLIQLLVSAPLKAPFGVKNRRAFKFISFASSFKTSVKRVRSSRSPPRSRTRTTTETRRSPSRRFRKQRARFFFLKDKKYRKK